MAQTEPEPIVEEAKDFYVTDVDFHYDADLADLLEYIENEAIVEKLTVDPEGKGEHKSNLPPMTSGHGASNWAVGADVDAGHTQGKATNTDDVVDAIREMAVDRPILTPNVLWLVNVHNEVVATELCKAYNDYVLDTGTDPQNDIYGALLLPQWDPAAAVDELKRHGKKEDFVTAYGWYGNFKPLGNAEYDPVFEKLTELNLPLSLHGIQYWPKNDLLGDHLKTFLEQNMLTWPIHAMMFLTNMLMTGAFDKYPELDIVILEAGTGWIPFLKSYLDEAYLMYPDDVKFTRRMHNEDQEFLEKKPSEYLSDNVYYGTQPMATIGNSRHEKAMFEMSDARTNFLWCSDWPHLSFDVPNWVLENRALDQESKERILNDNAENVFRF